jgi:hypothetical protein
MIVYIAVHNSVSDGSDYLRLFDGPDAAVAFASNYVKNLQYGAWQQLDDDEFPRWRIHNKLEEVHIEKRRVHS